MGSVAEEHAQQSFLNGKGPDEGVEFTHIPHPDWQPGDKQPNPWNSTSMVRARFSVEGRHGRARGPLLPAQVITTCLCMDAICAMRVGCHA